MTVALVFISVILSPSIDWTDEWTGVYIVFSYNKACGICQLPRSTFRLDFPARLSFLDISDRTHIYIYAVFEDPGGEHSIGPIHSSLMYVVCPGAPSYQFSV